MLPTLSFRQAYACIDKVEEIEGGGVELKFSKPVPLFNAMNRLILAIVWKRIKDLRPRALSQAPRRDPEITPEMIEAGMRAAWQEPEPPAVIRTIVERVYLAMERERLRVPRRGK